MGLVPVRESDALEAPKDILKSLYRLTPAEADLADALTVSRSTVRDQLAAVMAKMGVNRQAEWSAPLPRR